MALKYLKRNLYQKCLRNFLAEVNILIDLLIRFSTEIQIIHILTFNMQGRDNCGKPYVYYTMRFMELGDLFKFVN